MALFSFIHLCKSMADDVKEYKKDPNFQYKNKIQTAFCGVVVSIFLMIYIGLSMVFTTGLLIYHTKIIKQCLTTKEQLKKFYRNPIGNPYCRSQKENFINALFPKIRKESCLEIMRKNKNNYYKQFELREKIRKEEEEKNKQNIDKNSFMKSTDQNSFSQNINNSNISTNKNMEEIKNNDIQININEEKKKINDNMKNSLIESNQSSSYRKKINYEDEKLIKERNKANRKKNGIMNIELLRKNKLDESTNDKTKNKRINNRYEVEITINQNTDNNNNIESEKKELTGEEKVKVALNVFGNSPDVNVLASSAFLPKPSQNFQKTNNLPKRLPKREKK